MSCTGIQPTAVATAFRFEQLAWPATNQEIAYPWYWGFHSTTFGLWEGPFALMGAPSGFLSPFPVGLQESTICPCISLCWLSKPVKPSGVGITSSISQSLSQEMSGTR